MSAETILYLVIAGVISFALAVFMYGYRAKYSSKMRWVFGILRFITLFSVLLLLINPKFKSETYTVEKPKLPIVIDNSESIIALEQEANSRAALEALRTNEAVTDKFDVSFYSFGNEIVDSDSLSFDAKNTNIAKALDAIDEIFKNDVAPTVLISDGNQTLGSDFEFSTASFSNPVFPLILGDSTKYNDLKIQQLNTNRYSFLKNKFPVEALLVYTGAGTVDTQFIITQGAATVYRENVTFSEENNTKTISVNLPANSVGLQTYTARLVAVPNEKNTTNNTKRFAVEVIDEATKVLVVSAITHPDLGAIKKAIETNEQRKVRFVKPAEAVALLNEHQLVVLYQPTRAFSGVFTEIDKLKKNTLTITGDKTDWNFLNATQEIFQKEVTGQREDAGALLNINYGTFAVEDIGFNNFPPLATSFGDLSITIPHEIILYQTVSGIPSENALLATTELNGKRDAIWDTEGIWKWRAQSYLQTDSFQDFDGFIGKLVQYLASNKRKSRLEVTSESFYYNNTPIKISAQYFDQNYVFDSRASLNISLINQESKTRTVFPLLLKNNFYEVDVNSLPAGTYNYTVSVVDQSIARSGTFTILDYNVEQQFGNANVTKLTRVATNTNGTAYYSNQLDGLIEALLNDDRFVAIQKSEEKVVPLIDWKYLLLLIVLALSAEWFIRKYNGLI